MAKGDVEETVRGGERGEWPRTLLIWAGDSRLLEAAGQGWTAAWAGEGACVALSGADAEAGRFTMEVSSLPMWSDVQAVRLRQAELASEELLGALGRYLDKPSPSTALLVEYTGDLSEKRAPAAWRALLAKIESRSFTPRSPRDFIQKRLKEEGLTMGAQARAALEEWALGDVGRLASALDLLAIYKHGERTVEEEDLEALLGAGGTPKQWDLQDAFMRGDAGKVVTLLRGLSRDPDAAPLAVVGMLAKQMRALLLLHGHVARGRKRREIGFRDLGLQHPYPAQKLVDASDGWPEARTRAAIGGLYAVDLALKGQPGEPWDTLERGLLAILKG
jgi:DNA polymerase III delta subunit